MSIPTLQSVLAQEQLVAPDTFDGISTRAAEKLGCKGALFSWAALAHSVHGIPDEGVMGSTDLTWSVSRLVEDNCSIPLVIDVRAGFSDNLAMIPYDLERIVKAGAAAIMLDDRAFGCGDDSAELNLVSPEVFAKKIEIAVHAAENTNCMVLARSYAPDREEAVQRCLKAQEAGAQLVGAACLHSEKDALFFAEKVSGDKIRNNLTVVDGAPEVTATVLNELGYKLVFITFMEKAAFFGDMDFGVKNYENNDTTYADNNDFDGMLRAEDGSLMDYHVIFSYWKKWMPMEQKFIDMSDLGDRANQPKQEG